MSRLSLQYANAANLGANGFSGVTHLALRTYKVWGKEALADGAAWAWPTNALHRFFKVSVEMPYGGAP